MKIQVFGTTGSACEEMKRNVQSAVAALRPVFAAALLLAFGLGHCGVIGLAGTSAGAIQHDLD